MRMHEKLEAEAKVQCERWGFTDENSKSLVLNLLLRGAQIAVQDELDQIKEEQMIKDADEHPLFAHHNVSPIHSQ